MNPFRFKSVGFSTFFSQFPEEKKMNLRFYIKKSLFDNVRKTSRLSK